MVTVFNFGAEMQEENKNAHFENLSGIEEEKSYPLRVKAKKSTRRQRLQQY